MEFTFYPLVVIIQYVPGYIFSDSAARPPTALSYGGLMRNILVKYSDIEAAPPPERLALRLEAGLE